MLNNHLSLGIDLGSSGVRIAVINNKRDLLHTSSIKYSRSLEEWEDWIECCLRLIIDIPKDLKEKLITCAIAGTSGTLLACKENGIPIGKALPYYLSFPEHSKEISALFIKECPGLSSSSSVARAIRLTSIFGNELILRHQADWISGWLLNNWEYGEEANNLRMGWDISKSSWPKAFENLSWKKSLPKVVPSGTILGEISTKIATELSLPKSLKIVAGTTDSNAGVLATFSKKNEGITILGSTIVIKKFVNSPIEGKGISNHKLLGNWLCGGASNSGGSILLKFFTQKEIEELSKQINPLSSSGIDLLPLSSRGERFPVDDPNLEPKLGPRPVSDSLYLHALLEGLAKTEAKGWQKLSEFGVKLPSQIITIGGGAKNLTWKKIREREIGIPIKICNRPPAMGVASIGLNNDPKKQHTKSLEN